MATTQDINAELARRELARRGTAQQPPVSAAEDVGVLEAGLIGAGRGLTTIARGIGLAEPEDPTVTKAFEELQERRPIATTVGEIAGQTVPFLLPGGAIAKVAGTVPRVVAAAGLGAAEGGLITRGEGADVSGQLAGAGIGGTVAGVAELVLPGIARAGGKLVRRILGRAPDGALVDAAGVPSKEFQDALDKVGVSFDDFVDEQKIASAASATDPEQAARKSFLESQGLQPTKAQITRSPADFQAQQELTKTSGKVRDAIEAQEALLSTRFDNAIVESGGQSVTPTSTVTDALVNKATKLDTEISGLYKAARESAPGKLNIRFDELSSTLKRIAPSDRATQGAIRSILGDLQERGALTKFKATGKVSVETAEEIRKGVNQLFDPQQPFRNLKLREMKDALDNDVFRAAGDDVFQQARKAKTSFERDLARAKISKFDSRRQNLVRDVLENKIDPDRLTEKVVFGKTYRADDLKQLKDYIVSDDAGKSAFNDLRAEVLQEVKTRSFIGPEDAAGFQALSADKLKKSLAAIGKNKMDVLFTPAEQKFLNDMLKVSKLREPVRGTVLGEGPTAQAVNKLKAEIRKGSVVANLLSSVTFDSKGRAVLKASPERIIKDISPQAKQISSAAAQTAAIAAQQEQQ